MLNQEFGFKIELPKGEWPGIDIFSCQEILNGVVYQSQICSGRDTAVTDLLRRADCM